MGLVYNWGMNKWIIIFIIAVLIVMALLAWALGLFDGEGALRPIFDRIPLDNFDGNNYNRLN